MTSLGQAIRQNAATLASAQQTYKQDVIEVNTFISSVLTSNLPTLNEDPPDFEDYVKALESAKGGALDWVNDVMARILDVPGEVRTYNNGLDAYFSDALKQTATLVENPHDAAALALLKSDLNGLKSTLETVVVFVTGAVTAIENFGDSKLPLLGKELELISVKSSTDAGADQKKIDALNAEIKSLRSEIKSLTADIIALSIADGIALTMGIAATIAFFPEGALVWFLLGPAVVVATTYIALDAEKIKADKAEIETKLKEITGITADVATLQVLAKNYSNMADKTKAVAAAVKEVLQAWQTLQSDLNEAIADIESAISDETSESFSKVQSELTAARHEWDQAYAQAGDLQLDLQVNNAPLQYGMSKQQIQAALAKGQTQGAVAYYNSVGA